MKKGLVCLMLLLCSMFVTAQNVNNTAMVGTVTDASGAVVVGAKVTAVETASKVPYTDVTNAEGYYNISGGLLPGTYDITVEMSGFQKTLAKGQVVTFNQSARQDFVLKAGSTGQEITVSANNSAIQTDDSLLGETVSEQQIENLPMNGRNALDLAQTSSNVTVSGSALTGLPPGETASGAGTRGINNSITLDGISVMNSLITTVTVTPNPDALNAVQTQIGNYTAQYGSYLGIHVNEVTKSGTNGIHGAAFDYIQNDAFNSRTFFHSTGLQAPKAHFRYNLFGGVVSGPIVIPHLYNGRDKTFFMGSYQGLRQKTLSPGYNSAWTPAMKGGDFSIYLNPVLMGNATNQQKMTVLYSPYDGHAYYNSTFTSQKVDDRSPANAAIFNNIIKYAPTPNNLNAGDTTGNSTVLGQNSYFVGSSPQTEDQILGRIDHSIGEKTRIFGRYYWQKQNSSSIGFNTENNNYAPTWARNGAAGVTSEITPNLVNDLRAGFNWIVTDSLNTEWVNNIKGVDASFGIPGYAAGDASGDIGPVDINTGSSAIWGIGQAGTNWIQDDRTYQLYDQISWTKGKHSLMIGADVRRLMIGRAAANSARGILNFSSAQTNTKNSGVAALQTCGSGLNGAAAPCPINGYSITGFNQGNADASFYLGVASGAVSPLYQVKSQNGQWRNGFFMQDTWQISKRLTMEYGVRYELNGVAYSANGNARILDPTNDHLIPSTNCTTPTCALGVGKNFQFNDPNYNEVAPRIGFAYRVTDRIVFRGGGGIYYNANQLNAYTLTTTNYPFSTAVTYTSLSPDFTSPAKTATYQAGLVQLSAPNPGTGAAPSPSTPGTYLNAYTVNHHLPAETMYQWNLDNGIQLWKNAGLELQYTGSKTIHLNNNYEANQPAVGVGNQALSVNARRPLQQWGVIREVDNSAIATYEGLTTTFRQRLSKGLSANVSYTYAHALDETTDANNSGSPTWQGHLRYDYGNSPSDIKHRVVTSFSYTLPSLAHHNFLLQEVLGGWGINGIITMQSGGVINVTQGTDVANVGQPYGSQRPNWVHAPIQSKNCNKANVIAGGYGYSPACFDVTAYGPAAQYTMGSLHRNDFHGLNGTITNNLSLAKTFNVWQNLKFQLRMEAFNALNHYNMGNPGSVSFTQVGLSTSSNTVGTFTPSTSFGQAGVSNGSGTNRTMQLAGRIMF